MSGFKGLTVTVFLLGSIFHSTLFAQTQLQPVKGNPLTERPVPFPEVTCQNLTVELVKLKKMSSDHNQSVAGFQDEWISTMDRWFNRFVTFEGQILPAGETAVIKEYKVKTEEVQRNVWENSETFDRRFDEIMAVLPNCLKPTEKLQRQP